MTLSDKFWATIIAFLGVFFIVDEGSSYGEVIWFFIGASVLSLVLGYYTRKLFAWLEDH